MVTPNIPSSAIFSILPIWSPAPAGVTIMWRRHIESSFDYHEHYARVSPQWLRLQTMWSVTRLSQHPYINIIAIFLILGMYLRIVFNSKQVTDGRRIVMRMDANFKLINNALKCNPLNPFVQLINFSNLNEKIQLLEFFLLKSASGKNFFQYF